MFNIFIACLCVSMLSIPLSMHAFRFRLIDIQVFTSFRIYCHSLISFMLLVITCTCMPEPRHLIMCTCDCLSTPTSFIVWTRRVAFWQSWILMSRSWSLDRDGLVVVDQSSATGAWISSYLSGPSFFQTPLDRLARFSSCYSWVLSHLLYCISCFCASLWPNILGILYHAQW